MKHGSFFGRGSVAAQSRVADARKHHVQFFPPRNNRRRGDEGDAVTQTAKTGIKKEGSRRPEAGVHKSQEERGFILILRERI